MSVVCSAASSAKSISNAVGGRPTDPMPISMEVDGAIVMPAEPLSSDAVAPSTRSLSVICKPEPFVFTEAPSASVRSPTASLSESASMMVVPIVVSELFSVMPSAAVSVRAPSAETTPPAVSVRVPRSAMMATSAPTAIPLSACASSVLNVDELLANVMLCAESSVSVSLMLLLLSAEMPSTVMVPPVSNVSVCAVMFWNSAPLRFRPPATGVFPNPMPMPWESISVVAPVPLLMVPVNSTSPAVI